MKKPANMAGLPVNPFGASCVASGHAFWLGLPSLTDNGGMTDEQFEAAVREVAA